MSKDNTNNTCSTTIHIDDVKAGLAAGTYPTATTRLSSAKLRRQLETLRPIVRAAAGRFAEVGYDVEQTLALCDAFLVISSKMTASQQYALDELRAATRARDEALRALVAAKEALISLAHTSGVSSAPYESAMTKAGQDPIGIAQSLLAALDMSGHLLKYPSLVAKVRQQVEDRTAALIKAGRVQEEKKHSRVGSTQEKTAANGALLHVLLELARIGRILFLDDRNMKKAFSLTVMKRTPAKRGAVVANPDASSVDADNDASDDSADDDENGVDASDTFADDEIDEVPAVDVIAPVSVPEVAVVN
jgi:hypothetical protein